MSNEQLVPWSIAQITNQQYSDLKKAVVTLQEALDTGPNFQCIACNDNMIIPVHRGGVFPICEECLKVVGNLSKKNRSWMLQ